MNIRCRKCPKSFTHFSDEFSGNRAGGAQATGPRSQNLEVKVIRAGNMCVSLCPCASMNGLFKPHLTFDKYLLMLALKQALSWVLEAEENITGPKSQVTWVRIPSSYPTCCVTMGRDFISLNPSYCKIISPRPTSLLEGGGDNKDSIKHI